MTELVSLQEPTEPESRPRTSRVKILLAVLGVSVVVASLTLGPTVWRMVSQRSPELTVPPNVGTFTVHTSEVGKQASSDLITALRAEFDDDLSNTVDAIYLDADQNVNKSVIIAAATVFLFNPEAELGTFMAIAGGSGDSSQLTTVEPGPLNGHMKCGESGEGQDLLTYCGWADHGSIAIALFPGRSINEAAKLMVEIRGAIQKR